MRLAPQILRDSGLIRVATAVTILAAIFGWPGSRAEAQTTPVEPYYVAVTGNDVYLRSGPGNVWYAVGRANTGDMLRVDGEDFSWLRVAYPENVPALVSAEDADFDRARNVVVITKPTRLKARNIHGSTPRESWKNLLERPVAPGTSLKLIDTLRDEAGAVAGYLVSAPSESRVFISGQFTRRASAGEVEAWRAAERAKALLAERADEPRRPVTATTPATTANRPTPTDRPTAPIEETITQPIADPVAEKPTPEVAAESPSPRIAQTPAPTIPEPREESKSETSETQAAIEDQRPAEAASPAPAEIAQDAAVPSDEEAATESRPIAAFESLESAFKAMSSQPVEEAEIEPLIAEYRRLADSLPDAESSRVWRVQIQNRVMLLEVRRQLQENLREVEAASAAASRHADAIARRSTELDRSRPYELVGRLATSTIYDGRRLPLMYRLQSVEAGGGRTIAYIVPTPGVDLAGRLGAIVGVEGQSRLDPALRLRIVQPTRVETLTPSVADAADETR